MYRHVVRQVRPPSSVLSQTLPVKCSGTILTGLHPHKKVSLSQNPSTDPLDNSPPPLGLVFRVLGQEISRSPLPPAAAFVFLSARSRTPPAGCTEPYTNTIPSPYKSRAHTLLFPAPEHFDLSPESLFFRCPFVVDDGTENDPTLPPPF